MRGKCAAMRAPVKHSARCVQAAGRTFLHNTALPGLTVLFFNVIARNAARWRRAA